MHLFFGRSIRNSIKTIEIVFGSGGLQLCGTWHRTTQNMKSRASKWSNKNNKNENYTHTFTGVSAAKCPFCFFIFYWFVVFENINLWYNNIACSMCFCIVFSHFDACEFFLGLCHACPFHAVRLCGCIVVWHSKSPGQQNGWTNERMKEKQQKNERVNKRITNADNIIWWTVIINHFLLWKQANQFPMHQRDYTVNGVEAFVVLCFFLPRIPMHGEIIFLIHIHEYIWTRNESDSVCVRLSVFAMQKVLYFSRVVFKSLIINFLCNKDFDIEFPFALHFYVWRPWNRIKPTSLCCDENRPRDVCCDARCHTAESNGMERKWHPLAIIIMFDLINAFCVRYMRIWANILIGSICRLVSAKKKTKHRDQCIHFFRTSNFRHWARALLEVFHFY